MEINISCHFFFREISIFSVNKLIIQIQFRISSVTEIVIELKWWRVCSELLGYYIRRENRIILWICALVYIPQCSVCNALGVTSLIFSTLAEQCTPRLSQSTRDKKVVPLVVSSHRSFWQHYIPTQRTHW